MVQQILYMYLHKINFKVFPAQKLYSAGSNIYNFENQKCVYKIPGNQYYKKT